MDQPNNYTALVRCRIEDIAGIAEYLKEHEERAPIKARVISAGIKLLSRNLPKK